jgi:hypothetical protein
VIEKATSIEAIKDLLVKDTRSFLGRIRAKMSDLVTQFSESITTASTLCAEIKKTRHIGKSHTQLDLLEASLASRPSSMGLDLSTITLDGSCIPPIKQLQAHVCKTQKQKKRN